MPANQGKNGPTWHEKPYFQSGYPVQAESPQAVRPTSFEQCVEYVLGMGLAELEAYAGYKSIQKELASDYVEQVYAEGCDVVQALYHYLETGEAPKQAEPVAEPLPLRTVFVVTQQRITA